MDIVIPISKGHNFVRTVENEWIYFNPKSGCKPSYTIFWFNGLGHESEKYEESFLSKDTGILPDSDIPIRLVLTNAMKMPITVYKGEIMRSWYDVISYDSEN